VGNRSSALFDSILEDVKEYIPFGSVSLGNIPPDASYKQFASAYLSSSIIRKMIPDDSTVQDRIAKEKFIASNKTCFDWRLDLCDERDNILFSLLREELYRFFFRSSTDSVLSSWGEILLHGRLGPGSSIGSSENSLYAKLFGGDLTFTNFQLYDMYNTFVRLLPRWAEADVLRYALGGKALKVDGSVSRFVPKTDAVSRMICVEPSLNMFYQLGVGSILTHRLEQRFGINLSTQPDVNRRLACLGSKNNMLCTIDLSSASDSISLALCESILPQYVFDILLNCRSHTTEIDGVITRLNMMSTMGNGFTFPLQTIIFSCIVAAAYRFRDFDPLNEVSKSWSVFGDDIICRRETFGDIERLLALCGFKTNSDKTFSEGPFRESCGTDWFNGQPVRPVFIKKLVTKQDIFVAINLLNEWSAYTGIVLHRTICRLRQMLKPAFRTQFVPFDSDPSSGIRVPLAICHKHPKRDKNLSFLYWSDEPCPVRMFVTDYGFRPVWRFGKVIFNPPGLILAFLYGELNSCSFGVRHDPVRYKTKRRISPRWDYIPVGKKSNGIFLSWQQWETAVLLNWGNP